MDFKKRTEFKKPWAQRFNSANIADMVRHTEPLVMQAVSVNELADIIEQLPPNQRVEIYRGRQSLLPEGNNGYEMRPAYFMRDGDTVDIVRLTKAELSAGVDPQELIHDAFGKYSDRRFRIVRGYSWMPFYGNRRAIVPTVQQKQGWEVAAALTLDGIDVKIQNPRHKSVVYVPSRSDEREYAVRFANLPTGLGRRADWALLSYETDSAQGVFAGMGERSKLEQTVFNFHQIAAYLLRGIADPFAAVERTGNERQVLLPLQVNPFPAPSDAMLAFLGNFERVVNVYSREGSVHRERLAQGEVQSILSAWMHRAGPDAVFEYQPRFDHDAVMSSFARVLKN